MFKHLYIQNIYIYVNDIFLFININLSNKNIYKNIIFTLKGGVKIIKFYDRFSINF